METLRLTTQIEADGKLKIEVSSGLPAGPAEVVLVINPMGAPTLPWCDFYGLGKEVWKDEDAQSYVNRLRDEWGR